MDHKWKFYIYEPFKVHRMTTNNLENIQNTKSEQFIIFAKIIQILHRV